MSASEPQPTADLPSGDPIPSSTPPSTTPPPKPLPLKALLSAAPSNIDAFLAHVQRCLATPAGIDAVLLFLCYASRLSAAALELLTGPSLQRSAARLLALAASLPRGTTVLFAGKGGLATPSAALVLGLAARLRTFGALLSDVRTFNRLWGLLGMYFWARSLIPKILAARRSASARGSEKAVEKKDGGAAVDALGTSIAATQLAAGIIFQTLENYAYLAQKGILPASSPVAIGKAYRWSARFWGVFVGLKIGELALEYSRRGRGSVAERMGDKSVAVFQREEQEWTDEWRRTMGRQVAWFPLTIHWSLEQGLFSDLTVGAIASIPGVISMRDLWRRTAA